MKIPGVQSGAMDLRLSHALHCTRNERQHVEHGAGRQAFLNINDINPKHQ